MEILLIAVIVVLAGAYWHYSTKNKSLVANKNEQTDVSDVTPIVQEVTEKVVEIAVVTKEVEANVADGKEAAKKTKKAPKSVAKAEVASKRTRKGGKFVGDDKNTTDVNEAFKDGKAPKKPRMTVAK